MTRQEYLMDRYEDALFSLMMDKVATQEGEKALLELERLQKEASINVPETLHRKCLKTISRYFARKRAKAARHTVSNVISKIAIVALVGILTFTIAFAASPTFRADTMNFVMKMFDDHAEFRFEEESQRPSNLDMTVNWIPEGYKITNTTNTAGVKTIVMGNTSNSQVIIVLWENESALNLDLENTDSEEIFIGETPAMLFRNDSQNSLQLIWQIGDYAAVIQIQGENISLENLINIASNIIIK